MAASFLEPDTLMTSAKALRPAQLLMWGGAAPVLVMVTTSLHSHECEWSAAAVAAVCVCGRKDRPRVHSPGCWVMETVCGEEYSEYMYR